MSQCFRIMVCMLGGLSAVTAAVSAQKTAAIPSTPWKGNRLGLEDKVLPPWTPLKVIERPKGCSNQSLSARVDCWGRTYEFDDLGLPAQIVAKGENLLTQPTTLKVQIEGQPVEWSHAAAKIASASDVAVEINGSAQAASTRGVVALKTHLRLEYDGLIVYQLRLEVPKEVKVDGLTLDIPLRSEAAIYRHRLTMSDLDRGTLGSSRSGNLPAGNGVVDNDTYIPYAWLGDNDRGLFWLCESAQYWPNWTSKHAWETVREGPQTTMRLNLLRPGQTLPVNWEFEFGLQATPVKPLPPHWRHDRWEPGIHSTQAIIIPNTTTHPYSGYPESTDPAAFAKRVDDLHAQGIQAIPYSILHMMDGTCPEFLWFGQRWHSGEGMGDSSVNLRSICPYSAEHTDLKYSDFITWKNKEYLEKYRLDGLYHDCVGPTFCVREGEGHERCGWRDATGKRHWNTAILPWRKLYRRIYAMAKEVNPKFSRCALVAIRDYPHPGLRGCLPGRRAVSRQSSRQLFERAFPRRVSC